MSGRKARPTVFFVGDTIDGHLSAGANSLGKQARSVAEVFGSRPAGVLTGHGIGTVARDWSTASGMPVIILDHVRFRFPNPPSIASGLGELLEAVSPAAVCFPHCMRASQAAATLAWRRNWACITAVEGIAVDRGNVVLRRSIYGGKRVETVVADDQPQCLTLMPGVCQGESASAPSEKSPSVETRYLAVSETRFNPRSISRLAHTDQRLEKAQVVVAGGRGLGGASR